MRALEQGKKNWRKGAPTSIVALMCAVIAYLPPNRAAAFEAKDCEQEDMAWLALRACAQLLENPGLTDEARRQYHTRRGFAWLTEEEPGEAASEFTRALQIDPYHVKTLTGRARAHALLGEPASAAADWGTLIEHSSQPAEKEAYLLERGANLLAAGQAEAALADYAAILEANPQSIKAHIARAAVFAKRNDREIVLQEFELAQKIDPNNAEVYMERAQAAETWGDTKLAIENYIIALKMNPRGFWNARKALKRLGIDSPP